MGNEISIPGLDALRLGDSEKQTGEGEEVKHCLSEAPAKSEEVEDPGPDTIPPLPPRYTSPNVRVLVCDSTCSPSGRAEVFILGTAHVSQESCDEVEKLIRAVKPEVVFVELCPDRISLLQPIVQAPDIHLSDVLRAARGKGQNSFSVVYSWLLSKVAARLKVQPGEEFRVAHREAQALGVGLQLGDRSVHVTISRTWARLSRWQRVHLIFTMLTQSLWLPAKDELNKLMEDMKDSDFLSQALLELGQQFPSLVDTLVNERDQFMAAGLRTLANQYACVVAVVGKGHVPGIAANFERTDIDIQELMVLPKDPRPLLSPSVKWVLVGTSLACVSAIIFVRVMARRSSSSLS